MNTRGGSRRVVRAFRGWGRLACAMATLLTWSHAFAQLNAANEECLACHANPSISRSDEARSRFGMFVDPGLLLRSEHRGMACVDCHVEMTPALPHAPKRPRFCPDCHHGDNPAVGGVPFGAIEQGFRTSIHVERAPAVFKCTQCHNPHTFKRDITTRGVLAHNQVCLRCHGSSTEFQALVRKAPPDLDRAHEWLPNRDMHWSQVRCLDCHSSYAPMSAHLILAKEEAVRKCESCHSANSVLMLKLYRYRRAEETQQLGFLNAAIVNDAYVIGATRNFVIDFAGLSVMGATLVGIALHLLLRWRAADNRKGALPRSSGGWNS